MTVSTFATFGFADPLARALQQCGYQSPTPIQDQALPPQIAGRDLIALAETGSGKTATFVLPILNELARSGHQPQSREATTLILAPTRELAIQIDAEVASLSRNMRLRRAVVLGGVGKGAQINALKHGAHVLVATPGRLLDLASTRHVDLRRLQTLVLDEADRMFDMGFIRDIRKIVSLIPTERRTALFSATMPPEIRKLASEILRDPASVDLSPKQVVVDRIDQKLMIVRSGQKQSRLHALLANPDMERVIVFTRTKRGADKVTSRLGMACIPAAAIHGNKAQNARQRALNDFSSGRIRVLVATDIAARGIDVSDITHVVNFDIPVEAETYVHRIGRTARKGTSGVAISLCDPGERGEIAAIERLMKQKIDVVDDCGGDDEVVSPDMRDVRAQRDDRRRPTSNARPSAKPHRKGRPSPQKGRRGHGQRVADAETNATAGHRSNGHNAAPERARRDDRRSTAENRERSPQHARGQHGRSSGSDNRPRRHQPDSHRQNASMAEKSARPHQKQGRNGQAQQADARSTANGKPAHRDGLVSPRNNWNGDAPPKFLRKRTEASSAGASGSQQDRRQNDTKERHRAEPGRRHNARRQRRATSAA